nr:chemotaxis response regulator protein-glutamate methylesterase [Pleionea sp. CnH1-48]
MIVDDSNFFCRRVAQILSADPEIKIIGVAHNGRDAIQKVQSLQPDVITMDVEMPVMDGITALKEIMKVRPTPTLMLSSLTFEGAKLTLDALDAGAADFMLKSYEAVSQGNGQLVGALKDKIRAIVRSPVKPASAPRAAPSVAPIRPGTPSPKPSIAGQKLNVKLIAIGASTGGPVALQKILTRLPGSLPVPVTITQHMPGTFTGAFAQRMDGLCQLSVVEAEDSMPLKAGTVYIAPGGKQMYIEGSAASARIRVRETDGRLQYAPCVDVTYVSASKVFAKNVLAIVLTGMGADGREGSRILRQQGATVWTQDEESCVVYGMPMSVMRAGHATEEVRLGDMADKIIRVT